MWTPYGSYEYYISQVAEEIEYTWHNARDWCMANGGDLASIHNADEHAFITGWVLNSFPAFSFLDRIIEERKSFEL